MTLDSFKAFTDSFNAFTVTVMPQSILWKYNSVNILWTNGYKCYFQVLRRDLVQALWQKRPHLGLDDDILHHDNTSAHLALDTELDIDLLGFNLLPHPPYSPDLAPLDFRLFPDLKKELRGQRVETSLELRNKPCEVISSFSEDWLTLTFDQWVHRHRKFVATFGDYIEKVNRVLDFDV